jgi:hypothetical protein
MIWLVEMNYVVKVYLFLQPYKRGSDIHGPLDDLVLTLSVWPDLDYNWCVQLSNLIRVNTYQQSGNIIMNLEIDFIHVSSSYDIL